MSGLPFQIITYGGGIISLMFGLFYLISPQFLSYHKAATQKNWEDIDPLMQTLILALMRAVSGGALSLGFIIIVLQYQFNQSLQSWIPITILVCSVILSFSSIYAMLLVRTKTRGRPPLTAIFISILLAAIGYYLNCSLLPQ